MRIVAVALVSLLWVYTGCSDSDITNAGGNPQDTIPKLAACSPEDPVQHPTACIPEDESAHYADLWKREFMGRNNISESYFDTHISSIWTSSNCWNSGITFQINYRITIDWAIIDRADKFIVMLSSSTNAYQYLDIPRDVFLDDVHIGLVLDNSVFGSSVGPVVPLENLPYESCWDAVLAFQDSAGSEEMLPTRIAYYVPGKIPRVDGYPYFIGWGIIDLDANECIDGYFNLFSSESDAWMTYCVIE